MIYLDTHVLVWLYSGRLNLLSPKAQQLIENNDLITTPANILELQYLHEVGRIAVRGDTIYRDLRSRIGLDLDPITLEDCCLNALDLSWTRDVFDRIMVSCCMMAGVKLLTKDRLIHQNFSSALW